MLHNEYETVIIFRPDLDDAKTYGIAERLESVITENGGHLLFRDDWGKRKLAYPIQRHLKGHYLLLTHLAPAELVMELERRIRIEDNIIRFLTVKMADAVDIEPRLEQAAEYRHQQEIEAKARAEAEAAREAEAERARAAAADLDDSPVEAD